MAANPWQMYYPVSEFLLDGTIDLDAGDAFFAVVLLTSSYTPNVSTHSTYADISGAEVANGNGYTTGGVNPSNMTWTRSGDTSTLDADPITWTASGAGITCRYAALVHIAAGTGVPQSTDKLIVYELLDNTPQDVTATAGNNLTITLAASGFAQAQVVNA